MKRKSQVATGESNSKPTWLNAAYAFTHVGFFR